MAAAGAKVLMLRWVEYARRYGVPLRVRSSFSNKTGTLVTGSMEDLPVEQAIITGVAHDRSRGQGHRDRRCRTTPASRPASSAWSPTPRSTSTWSCRTSPGRHRPHRHHLHAAQDRRPDGGGRAGEGQAGDRLRPGALRRPRRQGVADRRRHALAPRRHGHVLRGAGRGRRQHRDHLHLGDPDLGGLPGYCSWMTRSGPCTTRSSSAATKRPSSTRGAVR